MKNILRNVKESKGQFIVKLKLFSMVCNMSGGDYRFGNGK